jgi:predicted MFS family arabinose efflux permease
MSRATASGFVPPALAGLSANLVTIGLARFAYTPLIPALIGAGWFTPAEAAWLGAINLVGYLAGVLMTRAVARRWPAVTLLRGMMVVATVGLFACAWPLSFAWVAAWRGAGGIAGGFIMVLAAPTVVPLAAPARRGLAGGIVFTGVGLGILASATLVPFLLGLGLVETWCGLGLCSVVLTALAWRAWPRVAPPPPRVAATTRPALPLAARMLWLQYGLNAAGMVPAMVFLVDFIARGLDRGLAVGAQYWLIYGLGAMVGPLITGRIGDRIGFGLAFRWAFLAQAVAIALPLASTHPLALAVTSVVTGVFTPGTVPLAFGRAQETTGDAESTARAWSGAAASFALCQAVGAALCSALFARTGSHLPLFAVGTGALLLAFAIDLALARRASAQRLQGVDAIQP